jgi:hypothetical protein
MTYDVEKTNEAKDQICVHYSMAESCCTQGTPRCSTSDAAPKSHSPVERAAVAESFHSESSCNRRETHGSKANRPVILIFTPDQ